MRQSDVDELVQAAKDAAGNLKPLKEERLVIREVLRDSFLSDEESLRMACLNFAIATKPIFGKEEDVASSVIRIADAYLAYVKGADAAFLAAVQGQGQADLPTERTDP